MIHSIASRHPGPHSIPGSRRGTGGRRLGPKGREVNRIKARCEELGITVARAADLCDMAYPQLSRIAGGKGTPTIYTALRIAHALGTTLDRLFDMTTPEEAARRKAS